MEKLKALLEGKDSKWGRRLDFFIQFLILVSLVSFSLETMPEMSASNMKILRVIEIFCVIVFTVEYVLRILVADKPFKFIFSVYGIFDLLAILPFYFTHGMDWRSLRAFRFLRLFQALKLARYNKAMQRFSRAVKMIREEFLLFVLITFILIYISAVGIYYLERNAQPEVYTSVFQSLWWSVCTLTTVGYGDIFPITIGGKIFTYFILLIGMGIIAIPAGLISSAMAEVRREDFAQKELKKQKHEKELKSGLQSPPHADQVH
jgi:voltage-gated potassium channel